MKLFALRSLNSFERKAFPLTSVPRARAKFTIRAQSSNDNDISKYVECRVDQVRHTQNYGHVILLKIMDGTHSVLPVYIGDFECAALLKEINKRPSVRPMTHDLMKNSVEALGFRVSKVRVTALIGNTYHARVHYVKSDGKSFQEVDVDARPSDAINLAVRFGAPIFINREVASRMAQSSSNYEQPEESHGDILKSCKEEIVHFHDPTIMHKLSMQLAIAEERFEDAAKIRDDIEKILSSDRELGLIVALETALEDQRFEEAARIRDELKKLRRAQEEAGGRGAGSSTSGGPMTLQEGGSGSSSGGASSGSSGGGQQQA